MIDISYLGHSSFKINSRQVSLIIDPYSEKIGFSFPKESANIVLVTHNHFDHNNVSGVANKEIVVNGVGEYEIKGVEITGFESFHDENRGKDRGVNTIYKIAIGGIVIVHLGDLGEEVDKELINLLEDVHILMAPVGQAVTLGNDAILKLCRQLDPKILLPMHYKTDKHSEQFSSLSTLAEFVKSSGLESFKIPGRLSVSSEKLPANMMLGIFEK